MAHRGLVEVLAVGSRTLAPKYRLTNPCATEFDPAVTLHLDAKRLGVASRLGGLCLFEREPGRQFVTTVHNHVREVKRHSPGCMNMSSC